MPRQEGTVVGVHARSRWCAIPPAAACSGTAGGGRGAGDCIPGHFFALFTQAQQGFARYRGGFKLGSKFFQRQPAPQVGSGGVPCAVALTTDEAAGQGTHIALPGRVVEHSQNQACGIDIAVLHEPPPVVAVFRAEDQTGALGAQAAAQDLLSLFQALFTLGNVGHSLQNIEPVDYGVGRPEVGRELDAGEHVRLGLAIARERFDSCQLAYIAVGFGTPELALDLAFHKPCQAREHGVALGSGQLPAGIQRGGFVRNSQQISRQGVTAAGGAAVLRWEVAGQTVPIQIVGQLGQNAFPHGGITQANGLGGFLFQTHEGIVDEPVAHAAQAIGQCGHERDFHAAARSGLTRCSQTLRWWRQLQVGGAIDLYQRGLLHGNRNGRHDALADFERIAGVAARRVFGGNFPFDLLLGRKGQLGRGSHIPNQLLRAASGNGDGLRFEFKLAGLGRNLHLHFFFGGVAQRELGAVLVALTHQRRQAADDLQVLRGTDVGLAGTKQVLPAAAHGHDAEAGERIVQWHGQRGFAVGVQLHIGVPQQQGVEQFARLAALAAITASRHGLEAIVAATDDFHLRGSGFYTPWAGGVHGVQQIPTGVGFELQQGFVYRSQGYFGMCRRLAIGQLGFNGDLCLLAHLIAFTVGLYLDLQRMTIHADLDGCHTHAEGGFAQINCGGWRGVIFARFAVGVPPFNGRENTPGKETVPRYFTQAPAQHQYVDVGIGAPFGCDFERYRGIGAAQFHNFAVQDAFAFHREQGSGLAEGHAHLQLGGFAGLVAAFFGQHVDTVGVVSPKPEFFFTHHIDGGAGFDLVAAVIRRDGNQFDFARLLDLGVAQQQATAVGVAVAHNSQVFAVFFVVVSVEAAYQTPAAAECGVQGGAHFHLDATLWIALHIKSQRLKACGIAHGQPIFGLDARYHCRWPDALAALQCLDFAIGVAVAGFQRNVLRFGAFGDVADGGLT